MSQSFGQGVWLWRAIMVAGLLPLMCAAYVPAMADTQQATTSSTVVRPDADTAAPASQSDHAVLFLGGQADSANAGYLGATFSLPGSVIGRGLAVRVDGFTGDYKYSGATLGSVGASFQGAEFDGVYQLSGRSYWSNLALGARDVNTTLAPFDVTNRRHGAITEIAASVDGGAVAGAVRADYYVAYGARLDDYALRASVTHTINPILRLGVEGAYEGDPTYALHRVGPYLGVRMGFKSELQLSTGLSQQTGQGANGYLRAGIYRSI